MKYKLEICANGVTSAKIAEMAGAHRIELCTNLNEGGTTPSFGQIKWCLDNLTIEIWPLIRPRGGDFIYNDDEFEAMLSDIANCKQMGCHGVVTGILTADANVDLQRCKQIIAAAYPMPVAFHRAFDLTNDLQTALTQIIKLGFKRILTSGGSDNALSGAHQIAALIEQANNEIEIMPGGGITVENITQIAHTTRALTFHTTAKHTISSAMKFTKTEISMGTEAEENTFLATSFDKVKTLLKALKKL